MAWFTANQITIANGSAVVTVDSGEDISNVQPEDALLIGGFDPVEIKNAYIDGSNNKFIELAYVWSSSTQTTVPATVFATAGDFKTATEALKNATNITGLNFSSLQDWGTLLGNVTFTDQLGVEYTARTMAQMDADVQAIEDTANGIVGNVLAPSKAEFLARHKGKHPGSGFVHWGKQHNSGSYSLVNQGVWSSGLTPNEISIGRGGSAFTGASTTDEAQAAVNNALIKLYGLNKSDPDFNPCSIVMPPAPDGLQNIDPTIDDFADLAAAIAAGGTSLSQSVINRQDLVLLEVWHEKISDKDVVYPNGLVQYGASTWEGISLQTSNVVQGYSAFYEGDTTTTGRSAVWSALSDANQALFIQDPANNIYSNDGELIQVRARARVIRGLEGSWSKGVNGVSPEEAALYNINAGSGYVVFPQGLQTTPTGLQTASNDRYISSGADFGFIDENTKSLGAFSMRASNSAYAHDANITAIPICLVSRLNQGAYHPVYNQMGAASWVSEGTPGYLEWNQSEALADIGSIADCLTKRIAGVSGYERGNIAAATSGRPDEDLYDSITADQIKDLRIDASGTHTPVSAHHVLSKRARNGEARGWEKQPRILSAFNGANTVNTGTPFALKVARTDLEVLGDISWITASADAESSGWLIRADGSKHKIFNVFDDGNHIFLRSYTLPSVGLSTGSEVVNAVFGDYIDAPYSEGLFQNVTGTPAEIAATFPNGVLGEWIPVIPDGTSKEYKSTKKNLEQYQALVTSSSGATWSNDSASTENTNNSYTVAQTTGSVRIIPFRAKANFTEEFFIDGTEFLYGDFVTEYTTYNGTGNNAYALAQSIANTIPTDTLLDTRGALSFDYHYSSYTNSSNGNYVSETISTIDSKIASGATSDGIQWETRVTSQDNLASLIIPYRQIKHNGVSYGAGLTFNYVNDTSNTTDDNGLLIQVGTASSLDDMNIILKENFNV